MVNIIELIERLWERCVINDGAKTFLENYYSKRLIDDISKQKIEMYLQEMLETDFSNKDFVLPANCAPDGSEEYAAIKFMLQALCDGAMRGWSTPQELGKIFYFHQMVIKKAH